MCCVTYLIRNLAVMALSQSVGGSSDNSDESSASTRLSHAAAAVVAAGEPSE